MTARNLSKPHLALNPQHQTPLFAEYACMDERIGDAFRSTLPQHPASDEQTPVEMRSFVCRVVQCDRSFRRLCCQPRLCRLHLRTKNRQPEIETHRIVLKDPGPLVTDRLLSEESTTLFLARRDLVSMPAGHRLSPRACKSTPDQAALHLGSADAALHGPYRRCKGPPC
ncbi:hypothetical protein TgHK011_002104 [Trichoderma gracile]|nr:hypothetical protein TgHK011_002104 [Trichoderma gracile]